VRLLFQTFFRTGAAHATVKDFREQRLLFPTRLTAGSHKGELAWTPLRLGRAVHLWHNPWYAGAYAFGRHRWRKQPDGRVRRERVPREQWLALLRDAHPGYISWEAHEDIERRLQAGAKAMGVERGQGPPREGPALLQGRVVCGLCGSRMPIRYRARRGGPRLPAYVGPGRGRAYAEPVCQSVLGAEIAAAVGPLLVDTVHPWRSRWPSPCSSRSDWPRSRRRAGSSPRPDPRARSRPAPGTAVPVCLPAPRGGLRAHRAELRTPLPGGPATS
jgi:hypothetical protein